MKRVLPLAVSVVLLTLVVPAVAGASMVVPGGPGRAVKRAVPDKVERAVVSSVPPWARRLIGLPAPWRYNPVPTQGKKVDPLYRGGAEKRGASAIPHVSLSSEITPAQRKTINDIWYNGGFSDIMSANNHPDPSKQPRFRQQDLGPGLYAYASTVMNGNQAEPYVVFNSRLMPKKMNSKAGADFVLTVLHEIAHTKQSGMLGRSSAGQMTNLGPRRPPNVEGGAEIFARMAGSGSIRPRNVKNAEALLAAYEGDLAALAAFYAERWGKAGTSPGVKAQLGNLMAHPYKGSVGHDLGISAENMHGAYEAYPEYVSGIVDNPGAMRFLRDAYPGGGQWGHYGPWYGMEYRNAQGPYKGRRDSPQYPPIRWASLGF